jgi:hypothetical protein
LPANPRRRIVNNRQIINHDNDRVNVPENNNNVNEEMFDDMDRQLMGEAQQQGLDRDDDGFSMSNQSQEKEFKRKPQVAALLKYTMEQIKELKEMVAKNDPNKYISTAMYQYQMKYTNETVTQLTDEPMIKYLNEQLKTNFMNVANFNTLQKSYRNEKMSFKPFAKQNNITNDHYPEHEIRDVYENRNINENVSLVTNSKGQLIPSRPILDDNSSRAAKSYLVRDVLTPICSGADYDRRRNTIAAINNLNNKYQHVKGKYSRAEAELHNMTENYKYIMGTDIVEFLYHNDERDQYARFQRREPEYDYTIRNHDMTLQQYVNRQEYDRNTLINLTDVQYFLTEADTYYIADRCNDGVFMTGTVHVPKNLDFLEHDIEVMGQKHGSVKLIKEGDEVKLYMQMHGNPQVYFHSLEYYRYTRNRINIITPPKVLGGYAYNFVVKCEVKQRIDLGGTEYIRFNMIKITKPKYEDLLTEDLSKIQNDTEIATIIYTLYDQLNAVLREVDHNNLHNVNYRNSLQFLMERMYLYKYINNNETLNEIFQKAQTIMNEEDAKIAIINEQAAIAKKSDEIILCIPRSGRWFNFMEKYSFNKLKANSELTVASIELYNKICTKIFGNQDVSIELIKSLVSLINREQPKWNLKNQTLPLITYALTETMQSEIIANLIAKSNVTRTINDVKNNNIFVKPENWKQAYKYNCLWKYIIFTMKEKLNINEKMEEKELLDTQNFF